MHGSVLILLSNCVHSIIIFFGFFIQSLLLCSMPPKKDKKSADSRVAEDLVHHEEREESVASKFTVGRESESTCFCSETLERIVAANADFSSSK